jgi:hypothetical protein
MAAAAAKYPADGHKGSGMLVVVLLVVAGAGVLLLLWLVTGLSRDWGWGLWKSIRETCWLI